MSGRDTLASLSRPIRRVSMRQTSCRSSMPPESTTAARAHSSPYITADCNPSPTSSCLQPTTVTTPFLLRFYIDQEQGIAYFYPPAPITPGSVFLSLATSAIVANSISGLVPCAHVCVQPQQPRSAAPAWLLLNLTKFITTLKDTPLKSLPSGVTFSNFAARYFRGTAIVITNSVGVSVENMDLGNQGHRY